jgi:HK97 family phage portal protein
MVRLFDEPIRFERRSGVTAKGFNSVADLIGIEATAAGIAVTPRKALGVPAVYASLAVIAQDIAKTPIKLRRRVAADTFTDAIEHNLWEVLHDLTNAETSAYSFKHQMMIDLLAHEKAFAEIIRVDGQVVALWRLDPERVTVDRDAARRKRWHYTDDEGKPHTWTFDPSTPPIFELAHPSPIRRCRELIATAIALQRYVGRFFGHGARPSGVLETDTDLEPDQAQEIRESFNKWHQGVENSHRVAVLENGVKFKPIAPPNDAAQLNETLQTIRTEVAAAFRLAPWKVGNMESTSYSNMEAGAIEHATGTLDPYFTLWEHAIRRDLLTNRQYGRYDVLFDRSALIRSDMKSLHDALAVGRQNGWYSANDVRRKLGENPIANGDDYVMNGNLIPIQEAGNDDAA